MLHRKSRSDWNADDAVSGAEMRIHCNPYYRNLCKVTDPSALYGSISMQWKHSLCRVSLNEPRRLAKACGTILFPTGFKIAVAGTSSLSGDLALELERSCSGQYATDLTLSRTQNDSNQNICQYPGFKLLKPRFSLF